MLCPKIIHAYPLAAHQISGLALSLPGVSVSRASDGEILCIKGRFNLTDLAGSKDIDHAFEGLDILLNFDLEGDLSGKNPSFSWQVKAAWPRGQVLIFPWFLDLSEVKGSLKAEGKVTDRQIFIKDFRLYGPFSLKIKRLALPKNANKGNVFLNRLIKANWQLDANIERTYNIFIRDAFSDSRPIVKDFRPNGRLLLQGKSTSILLRLTSDIFYKEKRLIKGLEAHLSYPLSDTRCDKGTLMWQEVYLAPLIPRGIFKKHASMAILGTSLPVTLCHKSLHLGTLRLSLGSGIISMEEAQFLFSRGTLVLKNIKINNLKVNELLNNVPLEIVVNGTLPKANFEKDRLLFKGKIDIEVAKGEIEITNIWIEPYAAIPRWGADISFSHIDLKEFSKDTSFGLVTGKINGWIKGLIMSGGQPEAFDLQIETDQSSKEPKKISIKAIENLSILGGGGGSVSFLGGLFKEFSYSRIGISCRLKNDVFELHGLYKSGGKEYLVKRGFWGGVNVINMNPNGRISFRDMLDRLKRISESGQSKVEVK